MTPVGTRPPPPPPPPPVKKVDAKPVAAEAKDTAAKPVKKADAAPVDQPAKKVDAQKQDATRKTAAAKDDVVKAERTAEQNVKAAPSTATRGIQTNSQPAAAQPTAAQPAATQPAKAQPAAAQPAATQPAATQPAATQPAATQPAATQPAATQPVATPAGLAPEVGFNSPGGQQALANLQAYVASTSASQSPAATQNPAQTSAQEPTLTNRIVGGLKMAQAVGEGVLAAGLAVAPVPGARVAAAAIGLHAIDVGQAGSRQLMTGQDTQSLTSQGVQAGAEQLGVDPGTARQMGENTDLAMGLATLAPAVPAIARATLSTAGKAAQKLGVAAKPKVSPAPTQRPIQGPPAPNTTSPQGRVNAANDNVKPMKAANDNAPPTQANVQQVPVKRAVGDGLTPPTVTANPAPNLSVVPGGQTPPTMGPTSSTPNLTPAAQKSVLRHDAKVAGRTPARKAEQRAAKVERRAAAKAEKKAAQEQARVRGEEGVRSGVPADGARQRANVGEPKSAQGYQGAGGDFRNKGAHIAVPFKTPNGAGNIEVTISANKSGDLSYGFARLSGQKATALKGEISGAQAKVADKIVADKGFRDQLREATTAALKNVDGIKDGALVQSNRNLVHALERFDNLPLTQF